MCPWLLVLPRIVVAVTTATDIVIWLYGLLTAPFCRVAPQG